MLDHGGFGFGHYQVVDAQRDAGFGGVEETEFFDLVEHRHRGFQSEMQVAVLDHLAGTFLFQQAVDVGQHLGQVVVQNHAADGGLDELVVQCDGLGVQEVLVVVGGGQVDDLAGVTQADRRLEVHLVAFQGQEDVFEVGKGFALALRSRSGPGQVVQAQHHILRGHGQGLAVGGREDVVRAQHQNRGFDLGFG